MNKFEMLLNINNDSIKFSLKIFIALFIHFKKTSLRFNSFFKIILKIIFKFCSRSKDQFFIIYNIKIEIFDLLIK